MATATLTAGPRVRTVEPWMTESDEFLECEADAENEFDRISKDDYEYRDWLLGRLELARADIEAGRVHSLEDVIAEFKRDGLL